MTQSYTLRGGAAADKLVGRAGDDFLFGGDGNDYLDGGAGDDLMDGGRGNDTYVVDSLADQVIETTDGGRDEVRVSIQNYVLAAGVETLRVLGPNGLTASGNSLANAMMGGIGGDRLSGLDGNDSLSGGDGDDILLGGAGNDMLSGGNGRDTASYQDAAAAVTIELRKEAQITGGAGIDRLLGIENVEGSRFGDRLAGSDGANLILGDDGDDVIEGLGGDDVLVGGLGSDRLFGGAGSDVARYDGRRADYVLDQAGGVIRLTAADGSIDVLDDIEILRFGDGDTDLRASPPPPLAQPDSGHTTEDSVLTLDVLANDAAGATLVSASLKSGAGAVSIVGGRLLFDPRGGFDDLAAGESGSATVDYVIRTATGVTATATAAITIAGANDAPVIQGNLPVLEVQAGTAFSYTVPLDLMVDSDGGAPLTYTLSGARGAWPAWLSWDAGAHRLSGVAPAEGAIELRITGTEADGLSATTTLSIAIAAAAAEPAPATPAVKMGAGPIFIQRDGDSGDLNFAGDAARVLKDGAVMIDWTSGGTLHDIPQGDGYLLQVRTDARIESADLAVGVVVVTMGQSNVARWFTASSAAHVPGEGVSLWRPGANGTGSWVSPSGAGILAFTEELRGQLGDVPIAVVNGSVGGTSLVPVPGLTTWADTGKGSLYQNTLDQLAVATGGRAEIVLWNQGENDVGQTTEAYATALTALLGRMERDIGDPAIFVSGLALVDSRADSIRAAQRIAVAADPDVTLVATDMSLETFDGIHLTSVAQAWHAIDVATAVANALTGGAQVSPILQGTAAHETLIGSGSADRIAGGDGDDRIDGLAGGDVLRGQDGADILHAGAGDDGLSGGEGADQLFGEADADDLFGDRGNDRLDGGAGDDLLDGGLGDDVMIGGAGSDRYVVYSAGDMIVETDDEGRDAGGVDFVESIVDITLSAFVENVYLSSTGAVSATGNASANTMTGGAVNNRLIGLGGDDVLVGAGGDDYLDGGAGNDRLDGGGGVDLMYGGAGNDSYVVTVAADVVSETLGDGRDAGGSDTVMSAISFVLTPYLEHLVLAGAAAIDGTGNASANNLTGNLGANRLSGGAGDDLIIGAGGNDVLDGGANNDTLRAGDGSDVIVGGLGQDSLTGDDKTDAADRFVWSAVEESGVGARDVIRDFDALDVIDLSAIDANTKLAGNQAFAFIGTAGFTAAGQVHVRIEKTSVVVEGDINGDRLADFAIELATYASAMTAGNFVL